MVNIDPQISLATLANASELGRHVIQEVLGNATADTLNGSPILRATIYDLIQAHIHTAKLPNLRNA